jgi:hypothetical protein
MTKLEQYVDCKVKIAELTAKVKSLLEEANQEYLSLTPSEVLGCKIQTNSVPKKYEYSVALQNKESELKKLKKIEELSGRAKDVTPAFDATKDAAFKVVVAK